MQYFVYVLYSPKIQKHYYGMTSNLQQRIAQHARSKKGFTASGKPWTLVGYSSFATKKEAKLFEDYLKNLRDSKLAISILDTQLV